ncbi:hypothetical protein AAG589_03435 [Isoptericola sp. F-RaC21]|uniref:hypothetical protein n=1 Tax=Isoptericola sp. F-RaC21 TaxID=3141452 RepID=UPI00315C2DFC
MTRAGRAAVERRSDRGGTAGAARGAGLLAATLLLASAAPAVAEPGDDDARAVALSVDGRSWSSDLDVPLFPTGAWVPGETRRSALLVRNDGPGPARGELAVAVGVGASDATALADAVHVRVRPAGAPWSSGGGAPVSLAESEVLPVALEVTLSASAGNETRGARVPVAVVVTLAGDARGPGRPAERTGAEARPVGDLPRTGGVSFAAVLAAVGAVVVGAMLRAVRPRGGARRG